MSNVVNLEDYQGGEFQLAVTFAIPLEEKTVRKANREAQVIVQELLDMVGEAYNTKAFYLVSRANMQ